MAAKKEKLQLSSMGFGHGRMPTKRSINLAIIPGEKKLDIKTAIPAVILIIVAAVLFSKYAVVDRLMEVSREEAIAAELQRQVDAGYEKIESFGDLVEKYAHYTYSGMTNEELTRADRIKVMDLISRLLLPNAEVDSWQVTGNVLTLSITDSTLQELNLLAQQLRDEPMVEFCNVTTAQTNEVVTSSENPQEFIKVTARMVVYLIQEEAIEE